MDQSKAYEREKALYKIEKLMFGDGSIQYRILTVDTRIINNGMKLEFIWVPIPGAVLYSNIIDAQQARHLLIRMKLKNQKLEQTILTEDEVFVEIKNQIVDEIKNVWRE